MPADPQSKSKHEPMTVRFPGGLAVESSYRGFNVRTDQPARAGGAGSGALRPLPGLDRHLRGLLRAAVRPRSRPWLEELGLTLEPLRSADRRRVETLRIHVSRFRTASPRSTAAPCNEPSMKGR